MKVLHVIPSVAPCRGGPSEAVLAMVRSLNREGTAADIVTTNDNGASVLSVPTGQFMEHEGARVCFLPRWSPPVAALREFQYAPAFSAWLTEHLADYDCLHVHAVFSYLSTRAMQLARKAGKPYVVRPLGQFDAWSLQQAALKKRLYMALIERRNACGAGAIHCTSATEASHVQAVLPKARVEVIPHGVEARPIVAEARARLCRELQLTADTPVLLFLSRWHRKKNIPLLLEALHALKDLPWKLVLAGSTDDAALAARVQEQIAALGLSDRLVCPGHVTGEAKEVLLQGGDVFVLPSVSENFGIAVAEALVSGLPVVVTPGVDLATVVQALDGGLVCAAEVPALAAALRALLGAAGERSASRRELLRARAAAHFSWGRNAGALAQLYEQVVAQK